MYTGSSIFFLDFCQENFLTQHILCPTRQASGTVLDLVLTTEATDLMDCSVGDCFGSSDHNIITFTVVVQALCQRRKVRRRNFRSTDWSKLRVLLPSTADWHSCLATEDIIIIIIIILLYWFFTMIRKRLTNYKLSSIRNKRVPKSTGPCTKSAMRVTIARRVPSGSKIKYTVEGMTWVNSF